MESAMAIGAGSLQGTLSMRSELFTAAAFLSAWPAEITEKPKAKGRNCGSSVGPWAFWIRPQGERGGCSQARAW